VLQSNVSNKTVKNWRDCLFPIGGEIIFSTNTNREGYNAVIENWSCGFKFESHVPAEFQCFLDAVAQQQPSRAETSRNNLVLD
jgi:hypothetical protein